jgi:predicted AlkP superfamily pyrophosphatase or phosphodiesterase
MFKRLWIGLFALLLTISPSLKCAASATDAHPKLVVILVIDQFREDYLERYRADFKGEGFNLFLDHGAYFPDCYFDYANLVTAAGHSTIATGAYTDGHGIAANQWWDLSRNTKRPITSVEDPRYSIIGLPASAPESAREGASPRNLLATTIGDEVRLATKGEAKLFGISLKDRAAILTAGHTANGAFWIDPDSGTFITSAYYMSTLPDWAAAFDQSDAAMQAATAAGFSTTSHFYKTIGPTDAAIQYELNFAQTLIQGEKLGTGNVTDVLTISISSTDILGHRVGPDAPEQRLLVDQLDGNLDQFFHWLDHNIPGGLHNVWIALSADHGVAPVPANAQQLGVPAATINLKLVVSALNQTMNDHFSPGQKLEYLLSHQELPYIALNIPMFERAGINELEAERAIQDAVPAAMASLDPVPQQMDSAIKPETSRVPLQPRIFRTFTRLQMAALQPGLPPTEFGQLIAHSYSSNGGWYVMLIPDAYQMQSAGSGTTHFSPWSYDRHVPLAFYGSSFAPGIYRGRVQPVDLAATLASLLNVNQPSASVGHILTEAIHVEPTIQPRHATSHRKKHEIPSAAVPDVKATLPGAAEPTAPAASLNTVPPQPQPIAPQTRSTLKP